MNKNVLFKEFESLESLKPEDFITIEQYGGGPDESCLKGTRNALNHFAFEILKVTHDEEYDYDMSDYVDDDSVAGIDSIEIVEIQDGQRVEHRLTVKEKMIQYSVVSFLIFFFLAGIYGFFMAFKNFF